MTTRLGNVLEKVENVHQNSALSIHEDEDLLLMIMQLYLKVEKKELQMEDQSIQNGCRRVIWLEEVVD